MKTTDATAILGIRHPVVLGPFGGGLSSAQLTSAVSNRGGLGSFGCHHLPASKINEVARSIRALTAAPFALNLWVSNHDQGGATLTAEEFERWWHLFEPEFKEFGVPKPTRPEEFGQRFEEQFEAVLEARPAAFSFVFGIPSERMLEACRAREIRTIGAATSTAEAVALESAGVDLIVATGFEAGGHRPAFLTPAEESLHGTMTLTQLVSRRVATPVIAAGGIADHRALLAAQALGASAVQVGTAFLACDESAAAPLHREALQAARQPSSPSTVLTRAFSGRLARGMRNAWSDRYAGGTLPIAPYPIQGWFLSQLRSAALAAGRTDVISLWSGQIAPVLRHRDAASVFDSLIQ